MAGRYQETPPSIDDVCSKALHLPCSPAILPRLAAALQSELTSAAHIERLISLDTSLATATLRLANSALYGPCPIDTLEGAILRLGAKELYRLAALVLIGRWGSGAADAGHDPGVFSRRALRTAIAAEVLAESTGHVDPHLAYTSGLVNEVGRLAMALSCGAFMPIIRAHRELRRSTWEEAENAVLGFNNAEVSWRLLTAWKFPSILYESARLLAEPLDAVGEVAALVAHVHAARYLAAFIDQLRPDEELAPVLHVAFLAEWDLDAQRIMALVPKVEAKVAERWGDGLLEGILPG